MSSHPSVLGIAQIPHRSRALRLLMATLLIIGQLAVLVPAAFAAPVDFDQDGRLDLIVSNRRAPLELYRNKSVKEAPLFCCMESLTTLTLVPLEK